MRRERTARRRWGLAMALWACLFCLVASASCAQVPAGASAATQPVRGAVEVLQHDQAEAIMPATVFFRGQTATTQGRNSGGLRLPDGALVLAALVDSGGYSSGVAERYQGYLLTEVGLRLGQQRLAPGAYGFGFLPDGHMVVMDLGGHDILSTPTEHDATLRRPEPLHLVQVDGAFRLYLGRSFVVIAPQQTQAQPAAEGTR